MSSEKSSSPVDPTYEITFDQLIKLIDKAVCRAYRRYGHRLNREDAEDLAQSIALSLLENNGYGLKSFEHKARFEVWLQTVANNRVLRFFCGQKDMTDIDDPEIDKFARQAPQEEEVFDKEAKELVDKVLGELTEHDREVLELMQQGLRTKEIAERLAIQLDSARKSKQRLIDKIRKLIRTTQVRPQQPSKDQH